MPRTSTFSATGVVTAALIAAAVPLAASASATTDEINRVELVTAAGAGCPPDSVVLTPEDDQRILIGYAALALRAAAGAIGEQVSGCALTLRLKPADGYGYRITGALADLEVDLPARATGTLNVAFGHVDEAPWTGSLVRTGPESRLNTVATRGDNVARGCDVAIPDFTVTTELKLAVDPASGADATVTAPRQTLQVVWEECPPF
ncbi:DUF4360 domain-containing protein [Pilimelia columellifera]|uniref:DUF4360 domain-containing protein n=1 Tax=Pilimelia columellifera subsp. columellifera TaxID=706583 RepID=A0ABP6AZJ0_9ACTN